MSKKNRLLISFDIDGTLTQQDVRQVFKKLNDREDVVAGIVTNNPNIVAARKIERLGLEPDFAHSAIFKSRVLTQLEIQFDADKKIHVGNRFIDKSATLIAGWEFIAANSQNQLAKLL